MMKLIGSLAILTRVILLSFFIMKFGLEIATYYGVFLIAIDVMQIRLDIKGIKNNDV